MWLQNELKFFSFNTWCSPCVIAGFTAKSYGNLANLHFFIAFKYWYFTYSCYWILCYGSLTEGYLSRYAPSRRLVYRPMAASLPGPFGPGLDENRGWKRNRTNNTCRACQWRSFATKRFMDWPECCGPTEPEVQRRFLGPVPARGRYASLRSGVMFGRYRSLFTCYISEIF